MRRPVRGFAVAGAQRATGGKVRASPIIRLAVGRRMGPFDGEGSVDRLVDIGQAGFEVDAVGTAEGDAETGNALLRPGQASGDGGSGQGHGGCDLLRRHPHHRREHEQRPCRRVDVRMSAGGEEFESTVGQGVGVAGIGSEVGGTGAEAVDRLLVEGGRGPRRRRFPHVSAGIERHTVEPAFRIGGRSLVPPRCDGTFERSGQGILGAGDITVGGRDERDDPAPAVLGQDHRAFGRIRDLCGLGHLGEAVRRTCPAGSRPRRQTGAGRRTSIVP